MKLMPTPKPGSRKCETYEQATDLVYFREDQVECTQIQA